MLLNIHKKQYAVFSEHNLDTIKNLIWLYLQPRDFPGKSKIHTINISLRPVASGFSVTYSTMIQPLCKVRNPSTNLDSFVSRITAPSINSDTKSNILYFHNNFLMCISYFYPLPTLGSISLHILSQSLKYHSDWWYGGNGKETNLIDI